MPIPFVEAGGPVNVYAIEERDGGLLLFDAGLGSPEGEAALDAGLRAIGRSPADVRRIVISHGHVDHYGGARTVLERAGRDVPVLAHPLEIPRVAEGYPTWRDQAALYADLFRRLGVPPEVIHAGTSDVGAGFTLARRLPAVEPLDLGAPLRMRHVTLEPMHMPGHTQGLVCLHDREHRIFISDDHLLERVSPNPLIQLGPDGEEGWRPLLAYVESVGRLRDLDVELVLPGHAEPFTGHRQVIDRLLGFFHKRQRRIVDELAKGPLTAWEVVRHLFPRAPHTAMFLTVSEALANLEVLEASGAVLRAHDGDRILFRRS